MLVAPPAPICAASCRRWDIKESRRIIHVLGQVLAPKPRLGRPFSGHLLEWVKHQRGTGKWPCLGVSDCPLISVDQRSALGFGRSPVQRRVGLLVELNRSVQVASKSTGSKN